MPGIRTTAAWPGLKPSFWLYGSPAMFTPESFAGIAEVLKSILRPVAELGSAFV